MSNNGPIDLSKRPIHLTSTEGSPNTTIIENFNFDGPSFEAYVKTHCSENNPGQLIMVETTPTNWASWECHTEGDEVVIVLEGEGDFIQQIDGAEQRIPVSAGDTVVNPKGVWHSADVRQSLKAIYLTPCPGTINKPRD